MKVKVEFRFEDESRKIRNYQVEHEPKELVDYFDHMLSKGFEIGNLSISWDDIKYFKITGDDELNPIIKRKVAENKALVDKRREAGIKKLGGKCRKCGSVEDLEFDHVNPRTKMFNMASSWTRSEDQIKAELKKCQLLCAECHKTKTLSERREARHGTIWRYKEHRCRCEDCTEAMRERWRKDNEGRKKKRRQGLLR